MIQDYVCNFYLTTMNCDMIILCYTKTFFEIYNSIIEVRNNEYKRKEKTIKLFFLLSELGFSRTNFQNTFEI